LSGAVATCEPIVEVIFADWLLADDPIENVANYPGDWTGTVAATLVGDAWAVWMLVGAVGDDNNP
jgi:hypothetical protein